jgi:succinyl-CoA synthetase beta subunit
MLLTMQLLEFQAKELLSRYDIASPRGRVGDNPEEAARIARRLGFSNFAVKAQVRENKRRAAGGVRFAASPEGVRATAALMLGQPLAVSGGSRGELVKWVLVEEAVQPSAELYVAIALQRERGRLAALVSKAGGEDIEERAAADPDLVRSADIRIEGREVEADFAALAGGLGLEPGLSAELARIVQRLARAAVELDATLIEINPLAVMPDGRLVALDAKVAIDDNALVRHPALAALRAVTEIEEGDPETLAADRHHLNYQRMDGDIGLVANGAGLALATFDMIVEAGGRPANFMDIRTTSSSLDVAYGMELILANPNVRAVLVNVHGGGMQRCDTIAEGVGIAVHRNSRALPIVVRLAGNNAEFARVRLEASGVAFEDAADIEDAVRRVVAAAARA